MNDFKWRHFRGEIILWGVRWYCKYGISYRNLEEMLEGTGRQCRSHDAVPLGSALCARDGEAFALVLEAAGAFTQLARRRDVRQGQGQMGLPLSGRRQGRRHHRLLPVGDAEHESRQALPGQGPQRFEGLGKAFEDQHGQGTHLWSGDRGPQEGRQAAGGDAAPAGEISQQRGRS